jgi:hypothetical protein
MRYMVWLGEMYSGRDMPLLLPIIEHEYHLIGTNALLAITRAH